MYYRSWPTWPPCLVFQFSPSQWSLYSVNSSQKSRTNPQMPHVLASTFSAILNPIIKQLCEIANMGHLWLQSYDFVWFNVCFYMQNISQTICFLLCCTTLSNNATLTHLISTLISAPHFKVHQWFPIALRIYRRLLSLATKALHNQTLAYNSGLLPGHSPHHALLRHHWPLDTILYLPSCHVLCLECSTLHSSTDQSYTPFIFPLQFTFSIQPFLICQSNSFPPVTLSHNIPFVFFLETICN